MAHLQSSSASIKFGRDQFNPLVPLYPKILHNPTGIVLLPSVPLPPLRILNPVYGILTIGLTHLGPFPHPVDIGGMSAYFVLGRRKRVPILPRLAMVPLQLLTQIVNLLADPSDGLGPDIALSLPLLSRNTF